MHESNQPASCPECGLPLPGGSTGWGCPACSLKLALSTDTTSSPSTPHSANNIPQGLKSRFFANYEILGEIARGGMGVVYRARQLGLNRLVALKMVQSHHLLSDEARLRFRVEIESVSQLQHPHIIPLYESGEQDGAHFFTMRLVEGGDLSTWLEKDRPLRQIILLLVKVCRAVHYAHQRGILHRDLKPSNILVDEQGEPHVADFGLARPVDQEIGFTFTSSVLGSPNYMAPEQASGAVRQLTTAVDVYGLGAILYHALAGRPPFQAATPIETLRQVIDRAPALPHTFKPGINEDLETIALKCLRKEQNARYGSAEELALDLERWLQNKPIHARPLGPVTAFVSWSRRHPALFGLGTALALAMIVLVAGSLAASWRIQQANHRTESLVTRMLMQRAESYFSEGESAKGLAMLAHVLTREPGHNPAALRLLSALQHRRYALPLSSRGSAAHSSTSSTPNPVWVTLQPSGLLQHWDLHTGQSSTSSVPLPKPVRWSSFSQDHDQLLVGYLDGKVELRHGTEFRETHLLSCLPDGAASLRISPSGQQAAVASVRLGPPYLADLRIWNTQSAQSIGSPRDHSVLITDIQFTPDESQAVTVCADGRIRFWPIHTTSTLPSLVITQAAALLLRFDASGRWMAVGEYEGGIKVWDTSDFSQPKWSFQHQGRINDLTFNTNGSLLVSASVDDTARVWNLISGSPQTPPLRHGNIVNSARFSPDASLIVTASNDNTARVWDSITGEPITEELPHRGNLNFASFTKDGKRIMTTTFDGSLALWELKEPEMPTHRIDLYGEVNQVSFSPDGSMLAAGTRDKSLVLVDVHTGSKEKELRAETSIHTMAFSPNNPWVAVGGSDRLLQIINTQSLQPAFPPLPQAYQVDHLEFAPDGRHLLVLEQVRVRILDVAKREYLGNPITHRDFIDTARFSPDGRFVITASRDRTVCIWSASTGDQVGKALLEGQFPTYAEYSADGSRIVVATRAGKALVFSAQNREQLVPPLEHRAAITHAAFSPTDAKIATASEDQTVRIWDLHQSDPLLQTLQHRSRVNRVEFSSDGLRVLTLSADGMVRVWDVATGLLVADPMVHPGATFACFSPDGLQLAVSSVSGIVLIREMPQRNDGSVLDLVHRAETVARQRFFPPDQFKAF